MFSKIMIGFSLLTSIFATTNSIGLDIYTTKINEIAESHNMKNYSVEKIHDALDIQNNDKYVLVYNDKCYFVVDIETKEEILFEEKEYPFVKEENCIHLFNFEKGDYQFYCYNNGLIWTPSFCEYAVSYDEIMATNINDFSVVSEITDASDIPSSATKIDNYEYFVKLKGRYGWNDDNTCTIVAIQILTGYYDSFCNDNFVKEEWDYVSVDNIDVSSTSNWKNWATSPGNGYIGNNRVTPYDGYNRKDSRMKNYLIDLCQRNVYSNVTQNGLNFNQQKNLLNLYMNNTNISSYNLTTCEGNLSDLTSNRNKTFIKSCINSNKPVIANGHHHSTVAFAYDNDYVYIDTGWGYCGKVEWNTYTDWNLGYKPTAICLNYTGSHVHSNNYYSINTHNYYCTCGTFYRNSYLIDNYNLPFDRNSSYQSGLGTYLDSNMSLDVSYRNAIFTTEGSIKLSNMTYLSFSTNNNVPIKSISFNVDSMFDGRAYSTLQDNYYIRLYDFSNNLLVDTEIRGLIADAKFGEHGYFSINCPDNTNEVFISLNYRYDYFYLYIKEIRISFDN